MFHPKELLHWIETTTNLSLSESLPARYFWSLYEEDGEPLSAAPRELSGLIGKPCELLIVLTTYARERLCLDKLKSLPALLRKAGITRNYHVLVLRDRCDGDYDGAKAFAVEAFGPRLTWLDARTHLGKPGYWKAYQTVFLAAKLLRPQHAVFLQDDVSYTASMLRDAYHLWERTKHDLDRRVVYLFSSPDDEVDGRWVRYRRTDVPGGLVRKTQWFDLQGYMVDLRFFELLNYRIVPVHPNRFLRRPNLSSGVGAQFTQRLFGKANVYQAMPPLVLHGGHQSVMNPGARRIRSLDNLSMATLLRAPLIC